jgi:hypothetical protein
MRRLLPALFLLLYGVAMLRPIHPLIDYALRYSTYANELCLNRDKPDLQCEGKCILMQRLQQAASEMPAPFTPSTTSVNLQEYPLGFIETLSLPVNPFRQVIQATYYTMANMSSVMLDIDHPPA